MNHEHVAIVLDLSANGIGIIRGLARKGIKVYAYDNEKAYKIGKSRLASCGVCPSPLYKEKELLVFLVDLAKNFKEKPVLYTGADDYLVFISKYQKELSEYYLFFIPEQSLVEQIVDKEKMYELAKKHNIPCPKTYMIERDEEFELVIEDLTFPCILKPVMGHEFRKKVNQKAILVQDADQLRSQYQLFQQHGKLLIQEIIPGDNQCFYKVATFYDDNMELLALFSLQKNHQFPAEFGTGAHIVSKQVPELVEMCLPFFQELKLKGIGMIEFKKDPRDGVYKFIEINPRFWLTHSLTRRAGIDFVYMYYLYVTNQEVIPQLQQNDGVKWIYLVRYYLTFRHKKQKGEMTWKEFYKGLKGQKEFALFAWDDPMPFIRSAYSHLINAWKRKRKE